MINVGRIVNSRNFAQPYTVHRQSGSWVAGRWIPSPEIDLNFFGTIAVATQKELMQIPEGDRVTGTMMFFSEKQIFVTHSEEGAEGTSDEITWRDERYRINAVVPWVDFGYYLAFGVRMVSN